MSLYLGAKFRVTCETCGTRQPRATTEHTASQWMRRHNRDAHPEPTRVPAREALTEGADARRPQVEAGETGDRDGNAE